VGPNSSGKSSFGHALAAVAHCQQRDVGSQVPTLTPYDDDSDNWPIDLGTLQDLRTNGQSGRVYISLQMGQSDFVELGFGELRPKETSLTLSYVSHPFSAAPDRSGVISAPPDTISRNIVLSRDTESTWWDESTGQQATVTLDGLLVRSMQHLGSTYYAPAGEMQEKLRALFSSLTYLRGSRRRPSRGYEDRLGRWQPIGYAGECTPTLLQEKGTEPVVFSQPPDTPASLDEAKNSLEKEWDRREDLSLIEALGHWLVQLKLAESVSTARSANKRLIKVLVKLRGQQPHDITEIGFGVSQVLPVLVAGLLQPKESLFIVDLPEAHLHPWPQARIADFFCSLILSGRRALVETHSEMFFHQLRLRAEMNRKLRDNIAVYFLDAPKEGDCQPPRPIGLSSGEQLRWPDGFLGEAWDTEKQIKLIRQAEGERV